MTRWSNEVTHHSINLGITGSNPTQASDVCNVLVVSIVERSMAQLPKA